MFGRVKLPIFLSLLGNLQSARNIKYQLDIKIFQDLLNDLFDPNITDITIKKLPSIHNLQITFSIPRKDRIEVTLDIVGPEEKIPEASLPTKLETVQELVGDSGDPRVKVNVVKELAQKILDQVKKGFDKSVEARKKQIGLVQAGK